MHAFSGNKLPCMYLGYLDISSNSDEEVKVMYWLFKHSNSSKPLFFY
jgi:hypothetical protein